MTQPATFQATFTRFFNDPVVVRVGRDLELDEAVLFQVHRPRAELLGRSMRRLSFTTRPYGFLPELQGTDRARHLTNFLFFMASIDHDTHRAGLKYEDAVDGQRLHGSDLLYTLAQRAKQSEPSWFLPAAFETISDDTVAGIFASPAGKSPADVTGRAAIFRACAGLLTRRYEGDAVMLLQRSGRSLGGPDGLLARLREFEAFADPVGKKAALLVKMLVREGLLDPIDPDHLEVAVDHVVMTMALRSGSVRTADPAIRQAVNAGCHLDQLQIDVLRDVTKTAMSIIVEVAGLRPDEVDDLIWSYGRISLRNPAPLAVPADIHSVLDEQLDISELARFIAVLNGVDADRSGDTWPDAVTVRGPYTRFF